ncbi:hypothetical protein RQP53_09030 [Paucibacter sp. APW11]|uniref:UspA domain-containing protein n=1 Tax=Roseateles aquae TaxID=3077235 RepID=A0ABU3PA30_9BURK|nr:hypothetical protein [Paucibacter sp. APW11]MDT8999407.1 hypothetical protein [Paucibacter sp. APW11]
MAVAELLRPVEPPGDAQLLACHARALAAAELAGQRALRCWQQQGRQPGGAQGLQRGAQQQARGYADLLIVGHSAELPALQRLGLIEVAGAGLWRVLGMDRFGGHTMPLPVALAAAQAAAQVISAQLPRLCISTRSFGFAELGEAATGDAAERQFGHDSARPLPSPRPLA